MKHAQLRTGLCGRVFRLGLVALLGAAVSSGALRGADGKIPVYQAGTISASGTYYFTRDITGTITVASDDVTLDLNGHVLSGSVGASAHTNIRITNGSISSTGYGINLSLPNGGFGQVDHITIAVAAPYGINVVGPTSGLLAGAIIEDDKVLSTQGSGVGIFLSYLGTGRVRSCLVTGVTKSGSSNGSGIALYECTNMQVCDNVATANASHGIWVYGGNNQVTRNNCSSNAGSGIVLSSAPYCSVTWNTTSSNSAEGINLSSSGNCSVGWNTAAYNGDYGIWLDGTGTIYAYNHCPANTHGTVYSTGSTVNGGGNEP